MNLVCKNHRVYFEQSTLTNEIWLNLFLNCNKIKPHCLILVSINKVYILFSMLFSKRVKYWKMYNIDKRQLRYIEVRPNSISFNLMSV